MLGPSSNCSRYRRAPGNVTWSVEGAQFRYTKKSGSAIPCSPVTGAGGSVSGCTPVATVRCSLGADTFPSASRARTVNVYDVCGSRPVNSNSVWLNRVSPMGTVRVVEPLLTTHSRTPTLSVAASNASSASVPVMLRMARTLVGTGSGSTASVVTVPALLCGDLSAHESLATTVNLYVVPGR